MTSTFPRWASDEVPRFVEDLCFELARSFRVVVLAPHCRGAEKHETLGAGPETIEVYRYRYAIAAFETLAYEGGLLESVRRNPLKLALVPSLLVAQLLAAIRLHRRYGFDALHAHWIVPQGLVATVFRRLSRRAPPVLVTAHGSDLFALGGRGLDAMKRWVLSRADAVSVVSSAMKSVCEDNGYASNVAVQSMGVDVDTLFTPPEEPSARSDLVYAGRLVEVKGVEHLVRAMAVLVTRFPGLRLTIVGGGPRRDILEGLAADLGVSDSVEFCGAVPQAELPRYLRQAAIFVMPSMQEGLGLAAVEAMGCGCAVVASDLPAIADVIADGETGLVAEAGNSGDLAEKIASLLLDDELRDRLAANGRRHAVSCFSWPTVGDRYAGIIGGMLR